jgi:hypothetical protein
MNAGSSILDVARSAMPPVRRTPSGRRSLDPLSRRLIRLRRRYSILDDRWVWSVFEDDSSEQIDTEGVCTLSIYRMAGVNDTSLHSEFF